MSERISYMSSYYHGHLLAYGRPTHISSPSVSCESVILFLELVTQNMCQYRHQNTLYLQRWQILQRQFLALSRFMLCLPCSLHIKDLPSIIVWELIIIFKKKSSPNLPPLGGISGYFAAVSTRKYIALYRLSVLK